MVSVYSIWQIDLVLKVEGQDGLTFYICDLYRSRHRHNQQSFNLEEY